MKLKNYSDRFLTDKKIDKSFLYDRKLNSYWSQLSDDAMSFEDALTYVSEFGEEWRLPDRYELGTIFFSWVSDHIQDGKMNRDSTRSQKGKWPNDWIPERYIRLIKKSLD